MIDTKVYRDCNGIGRNVLEQRIADLCDELEEEREHTLTRWSEYLRASRELDGIRLPGWFCPTCGVFNGEAKQTRDDCRSCGALFMRIPGPEKP